ncbi:MAG: hypothetical protein MUF64_29955 [Polyangiaceae bacterium]|nr:hypothetical protein [Polyangiaceae bacterium]
MSKRGMAASVGPSRSPSTANATQRVKSGTMTFEELTTLVQGFIRDWATERECCPDPAVPFFIALRGEPGDRALALELSMHWFARCLDAPMRDYRNPGTMRFVTGYAGNLALLGEPPRSTLLEVASAKVKTEPVSLAIQRLIRCVLQIESAGAQTSQLTSWKTLPEKIGKVAPASLYRFAVDPSQRGWRENAPRFLPWIALIHGQHKGIDQETIWGAMLKDLWARA